MEFTSSSVGSLATYSCDEGFTISGSRTRICRPNGLWSGEQPTCTSKYMNLLCSKTISLFYLKDKLLVVVLYLILLMVKYYCLVQMLVIQQHTLVLSGLILLGLMFVIVKMTELGPAGNLAVHVCPPLAIK